MRLGLARHLVSIAVSCGLLLAVRTAHARACAVDGDCPRGFACEPLDFGADGGLQGLCASFDCQSDADCGAGTRCEFGVGTRCVEQPDGGQSCAPFNECVPQWDAPCTADSDCGPGFTCSSGGAGYYDCGPSQFDASVPPYAKASTISCNDVPRPPFIPTCGDGSTLGCVPSLCDYDAGGTCLALSWNICLAQATPSSCATAADCPSTWSCDCSSPNFNPPATTYPVDAPYVAVDAACTLSCIPPNSDLLNPIFNAPAGDVDAGAATGAPSPAASSPATPAAAAPAHATGGCQVSGERPSTSPALAALALALAFSTLARRRRAR